MPDSTCCPERATRHGSMRWTIAPVQLGHFSATEPRRLVLLRPRQCASLIEGVPLATPTTVDEYLAALPEDRRAVMEELRAAIVAAAPDAVESIAYQMPAFRSHGGQFLVSYAAF